MGQPSWAAGADTGAPSPARVYDFFLGGSHNFEVDRQMARQLEQAMPDIGEIMRANRSFLRRAVAYLVEAGVRQFLDLGSGIPTVGNVHEVARRTAGDIRVVYVDIDPVAVAHAHAVLGDDPMTGIVEADLRRPEAVLADPVTTRVLDFDRPVAVLLVGVLHQIETGTPEEMIAGYRRVLAPGSHLALSQASADHREQEVRRFQQTYNQGYSGPRMTLRSRAEVLRMLDGFELVEPGLVQVPEWRPDEPGQPGEQPERYSTYAAVGRLG